MIEQRVARVTAQMEAVSAHAAPGGKYGPGAGEPVFLYGPGPCGCWWYAFHRNAPEWVTCARCDPPELSPEVVLALLECVREACLAAGVTPPA